MIVEICANSFDSALAAQKGGADRIELCTDLSVGGLTPSYDLIEKVLNELQIPVHVLIRPRSGDFVYSEAELDKMRKDIQFCKFMGCSGVVSGVLTYESKINTENTALLIAASGDLEFTFHRAFDVCKDPLHAVKMLMDLGVDRLLSSGQAHKAIDGINMLKEIKALSEEKIQIMPGSGITSENVLAFKNAGFEMVHLSAIKKIENISNTDLFNAKVEGSSDLNEIIKVKNICTS